MLDGIEMPVTVNGSRCNGCRICYDICPLDVFDWDEEKDVPLVEHPDECWYCGCCYFDCSRGAIDITLPPMMM